MKTSSAPQCRLSAVLPCVLSAVLLAACAPFENTEFANVPDFEVRNISFEPERKTLPNVERDDRYYLMNWTVLGPVVPEGDSVVSLNIENEPFLCGLDSAPGEARWSVKHFRSEKGALPGTVDLSPMFSAAGRQSVFYACATLRSEENCGNLTLHAASAAPMRIFLNGKSVYLYDGPGRGLDKPDAVAGLSLRKGWNRLVVKYRDAGDNPVRRAFSLRFSAQGKSSAALIR